MRTRNSVLLITPASACTSSTLGNCESADIAWCRSLEKLKFSFQIDGGWFPTGEVMRNSTIEFLISH